MKKGMNQGIRRRWMVNSIGMVFFVLLLAVTAFSAFVGNYYYNSIRSAMQTQATAVSDFFSNYATSEQVYLEMANYYVNDFDKQESLELQFINTSGQIVLSSYGLTSGGSPDTADITSAIKHQEVSSWSGQNPATGERIMAVSSPIFYGDEMKGVVRLVSSLELVDHQFLLLILIALGVSLAAVTMVYVTNLYFIRSIVEPMASITETAKRIAAGSYGIQIEPKYDDEIGELATTINEMSQKISQNNKMQTEFISSVSHELRTPLTAIRTPYLPIGSCTGKSTSGWTTTPVRRSSPPSPATRNGCGRCFPICWTTRPSMAAATRSSRRASRERATRWSSPSETTAPAWRRRTCPT